MTSRAELIAPPGEREGLAKPIGTAMVLVMLALMFLRAPQIFTAGRVYGEEGAVLGIARDHGLGYMLVWTAPAIGYLVLHLNLVAYLATHVFPLRYAGWLFTSFACVTALLPYLSALADPAWRRRAWLLLGLPLLLTFVSPHPEVWLNMACGQFPLSLAAGVLLALDAPRDRWRHARCVVLFFAGTAGMASVILAPLFVIRAIWERDRQRAAQAGVLCACLALQLFLVHRYAAARARHTFTPTEVATVITAKQLQVPFFGLETHDPGSPYMSPGTRLWTVAYAQQHREMTAGGWAVIWAAPACIYGVPLLMALRARSRAALFMIAAAMTMVAASFAGSLHSADLLVSAFVAGRYYFAPNVLLAIATLLCAGSDRLRPWWRGMAAAALVWLVAVGAREFFRPSPGYFDSPSWFSEVDQWSRDHNRTLHFAPGWQLQLR